MDTQRVNPFTSLKSEIQSLPDTASGPVFGLFGRRGSQGKLESKSGRCGWVQAVGGEVELLASSPSFLALSDLCPHNLCFPRALTLLWRAAFRQTEGEPSSGS